MDVKQAFELWSTSVKNLKADYSTHFVYSKCIQKVQETLESPPQKQQVISQQEDPAIFDPITDEDVSVEQPKKRTRTRSKKG